MSNFLSNIAQNLKEYLPGEQPQADTWIKLNTNEFPYHPSPHVKEELKKISSDYKNLRKYPHPFSEPLRSQLAKQWSTSPENVLVTNGSDEALMLITRTIFSEGEIAAFPKVTYSLYETILASVGAISYQVPMITTSEPLRVNLDALEKSNAKAIFLANPNAITGEYIETNRLKEIIQKSNKFWIIDEAYINFVKTEKASFLNHCDNKKNLIVIQTFSKGYGLAGLRVGYAISKNKNIMKALYQIKDSYNQDYIAIQLASRALKDLDYYKNKIKEMREQKTILTQILRTNNFFVLSSQANFVLARPQQKTAKEIYQKLKEKKILVRHFKNTLFSDYLRISVGSPKEIQTISEEIKKI